MPVQQCLAGLVCAAAHPRTPSERCLSRGDQTGDGLDRHHGRAGPGVVDFLGQRHLRQGQRRTAGNRRAGPAVRPRAGALRCTDPTHSPDPDAQLSGGCRGAGLPMLQSTSSIPTALLVALLAWLSIIFGSFGLFTPRNTTVVIVVLMCALSTCGSILLIEELNRPLDGLIGVSLDPMRDTLSRLGR